jgi:hypothetical protein
LALRDIKLGQLEAAERAVALGGKRKTIRPKGSGGAVDQIEWLVAEVARLERAVLEARDRALVFNSTPSSFVLFRWAAARPSGHLLLFKGLTADVDPGCHTSSAQMWSVQCL